MINQSKNKFLINQLLRGVVLLILFVSLFILFKKIIKPDFLAWLEPVYDNNLLVIFIFSASEIIVGIIPPEIFFIWATHFEKLDIYLHYAILLSIISYCAGLLAFWFGKKLNKTLLFRYFKRKYLEKYNYYLNNYGFFLIIVASMTPVPYSGTAMLMGSVNYPFRRYALYALARFIRFLIYTWVFWEANLY